MIYSSASDPVQTRECLPALCTNSKTRAETVFAYRWEPRENISASDLIEEFERKHLVPQKSKRSIDKKAKARRSI